MTDREIADKVAGSLIAPTFEIGDIVRVITRAWKGHEGTVAYIGSGAIEIDLHEVTDGEWITFRPWELEHVGS